MLAVSNYNNNTSLHYMTAPSLKKHTAQPNYCLISVAFIDTVYLCLTKMNKPQ